MSPVAVQLQFDRTLTAAADVLGSSFAHYAGDVAILPSSLDAKDIVAAEVQRRMAEDATARIVTPLSGAAARRAWVTPTVLGDWVDVDISAPGTVLDSALVQGTLVHARYRVIATDIVEVARRGPFVLDLPMRYLHPRHRMRLVADKARAEFSAEIASAVRIDLVAMALILKEGTVLAVTRDLIAAELVALALSERVLGGAKAFTGPWEDAVVQRATELDLGVSLPSQIRLVRSGPVATERWAEVIHDHVRRRLGIV